MSDHPKRYPRADALKVAKELCAYLTPHVERISVLGSLRRRKLHVGDIEILFIPKFTEEKDGLFDIKKVNQAELAIESLLTAGCLEKRPSKVGIFAWGAQNKLGIHKPTGIPVDLFSTDEERWWVAKVIRTGGKDTNLALTTGAQALGRKLHAYGKGVVDVKTGELFNATCEEDVFRFCGVPYEEPHNRR